MGRWVSIAADDESGDAVLTLDTEFTNRSLVNCTSPEPSTHGQPESAGRSGDQSRHHPR